MKAIKTSLICLCVLLSCKEKKIEVLNYDINKLQVVMEDMYVASEALKKIEPDQKDSFITVFRTQIEAIHNVDLNLIEADITNLEKQPEKYLTIHKEIRDSLIALEARVNKMKYD